MTILVVTFGCSIRQEYDGIESERNMDDQTWLTERFEENRSRLRGVAYRMLGSLSEAEDAVQEA
jgi:DNA-directed RNA polymerase specialized sigma24 family protein